MIIFEANEQCYSKNYKNSLRNFLITELIPDAITYTYIGTLRLSFIKNIDFIQNYAKRVITE